MRAYAVRFVTSDHPRPGSLSIEWHYRLLPDHFAARVRRRGALRARCLGYSGDTIPARAWSLRRAQAVSAAIATRCR